MHKNIDQHTTSLTTVQSQLVNGLVGEFLVPNLSLLFDKLNVQWMVELGDIMEVELTSSSGCFLLTGAWNMGSESETLICDVIYHASSDHESILELPIPLPTSPASQSTQVDSDYTLIAFISANKEELQPIILSFITTSALLRYSLAQLILYDSAPETSLSQLIEDGYPVNMLHIFATQRTSDH